MQYGFETLGYYGIHKLNYTDNDSLTMYHIRQSFKKTQSMFDYKNLPETIPKRYLELVVQALGHCTFFKYQDKLYIDYGQLGGVPNEIYMPTISIISNPYLKCFKELAIDKECVIMPNDSLYDGLYSLNSYYANQLKDNDQSRRLLMINLRAIMLMVAKSDDDYDDCNDLLKKLEKGELSAVLSKSFQDRLETLPYGAQASAQNLIQLLEDKQYIKGSWLNDLGVQSNYNMKREAITSNENILNVDGLLPLVDDMLEQRELAIEKVNKMFGTNISVELGSAWKKIRTEISISEERQQKEVKELNKSSNRLDKDGEQNEDV